jgi:hypothetical protein
MRDSSLAVPFEREIRLILSAAMVLFIYTVAVGILNGLDIVEFEHKPLLAHLHVGTLGWITLAVFAASLALFGTEASAQQEWLRWTARLAPAVAALYNVAFLTTTSIARPILGTLMMLTILAMAIWGFAQARGRLLSVPHIGVLAGLATSVIGAVLGVLLGIRIANPDSGLPESLGGAHPATMVVGFLIPVGMAFSEWVMRPDSATERAGRLGWLQIGLPFLGGVSIVLGILLDLLPLIMLSLPFELIGLLIFLWRLVPVARRVSWSSASPTRHGVVGLIFLVVNISIFMYLIVNYADDFEAAPRRLFLALDHSIFVGVLTMNIVGFIATFSMARPTWVDHVVFAGISIGVAAFVAGLILDTNVLIRAGTPVLGLSLLFAIVVHLAGLQRRTRARVAA